MRKSNIVYYTHISDDSSAGLFYSIPAQIQAQSRIDNVYWFNRATISPADWKSIPAFHSLDQGRSARIRDFPEPFNTPDLVVFESFYAFDDCVEALGLMKRHIPYIIVPRGALTEGAQESKKWKKRLGNLAIFSGYARGAAAIHYLTMQEQAHSGDRWNDRHFVIPNGVEEKRTTKTVFNSDLLSGAFIGRLSMYHKGIDLLIEACALSVELLVQNRCVISIYGPTRHDYPKISRLIEEAGLGQVLRLKGEIHGHDKEQALLSSDFFVLTSRFEGHPTGLLEALSYGLPCLVTEGTNMAAEVERAQAGWIAGTDTASLSDALARLIAEKRFLKEKGRNALLLSKQYAWDAIAARSHAEYLRVVGG